MGISIQINNIGKRYLREWIFRKLSVSVPPASKYVLLGANGSGKSTLLQVMANFQIPTEGIITYSDGNSAIEPDNIYQSLSIASPYMELIEEYTPVESIEHQAIYKAFQNSFSTKDVLEIAQLSHASAKHIKFFSSGMKQRLKIALAVLADCPLLLLDEPVSNLDKQAIEWYKQLIQQYAMHKTIVVCSNKISDEYEFCDKQIDIENYK